MTHRETLAQFGEASIWHSTSLDPLFSSLHEFHMLICCHDGTNVVVGTVSLPLSIIGESGRASCFSRSVSPFNQIPGASKLQCGPIKD
jgi:hypothetical protein